MEKIAVERTVWIAAPRERVWQFITDDERIGKWWPPDQWEFISLEVGGTITFGEEPDMATAKIEVLDPPHRFAFGWEPNPHIPVSTMVTAFVLDEADGGTRVTVTDSGFEALPEDIRQQRADQTARGFELVLADLKALLEQTA